MADYRDLYVELYCAVNEALQHLAQGKQEEAVINLLEGQVNTVKQIFGKTET